MEALYVMFPILGSGDFFFTDPNGEMMGSDSFMQLNVSDII